MKRIKIPFWPLLVGPWMSIGLGVLLNAIVMAANQSQMPVQLWGGAASGIAIDPNDVVHVAMTAHSHLKFLADWIVISSGIASPGDMFIWAGEYSYLPAIYAWLALIIQDYNK